MNGMLRVLEKTNNFPLKLLVFVAAENTCVNDNHKNVYLGVLFFCPNDGIAEIFSLRKSLFSPDVPILLHVEVMVLCLLSYIYYMWSASIGVVFNAWIYKLHHISYGFLTLFLTTTAGQLNVDLFVWYDLSSKSLLVCPVDLRLKIQIAWQLGTLIINEEMTGWIWYHSGDNRLWNIAEELSPLY